MSDAYTLHLGDCIAVMRAMPDDSVDSIVTDPPYELGFMGKSWDATGIAYSVEMWREALRVLKPGGHLLSFGGSRTYHRMACAIEDAGFEIRDQIMWVYGSGFPKSLNVSKAIESGGGRPEDIRRMQLGDAYEPSGRGRVNYDFKPAAGAVDWSPQTDAAREWDGWGTALKPSHEPVCVARKPLVGTVAANVLQFGTGAINIGGCRVAHVTVDGGSLATNPHLRSHINGGNGGHIIATETERRTVTPDPAGRWPANLIHDGSPEVLALFPAQAGAAAPVHRRRADKFRNSYGAFAGDIDEAGSTFHGDSGSAARFFYCAKANRRDRNEGCEDIEKKPLLWSSGTQNPGSFQAEGTDRSSQNHHPTVKPVSLMQWLVRLVTPPGGVVYDPFMGSGSTGKACMREGFRFIGSELKPEYLRIAEARIRHALAALAPPPEVPTQIDLFAQA